MATEVPHARVFAVERSTSGTGGGNSLRANLTLVHGDLASAFDELRGARRW